MTFDLVIGSLDRQVQGHAPYSPMASQHGDQSAQQQGQQPAQVTQGVQGQTGPPETQSSMHDMIGVIIPRHS